MTKLRFEISIADKNILSVFLLKGDFSTGEIKNIAMEFENLADLSNALNNTVNKIMGE